MTIRCCTAAIFALIIWGCNSNSPIASSKKERGKTWSPPPAGSIVAADSMPYEEDPLNHYYFAVKLRVSSDNGHADNYGMTYDVLAGYGPAQAQSTITMPRGGDDLQPLVRRDDSEKYGYIIGFIPGRDHGGDSTFQPYYKVTAQRGEIVVKALKGYVFE